MFILTKTLTTIDIILLNLINTINHNHYKHLELGIQTNRSVIMDYLGLSI